MQYPGVYLDCSGSQLSVNVFFPELLLQKLSIYGDLDYLKTLDNKELLASIHPQEAAIQAAPLPIKIKVERI